jgi:hypothetical protein
LWHATPIFAEKWGVFSSGTGKNGVLDIGAVDQVIAGNSWPPRDLWLEMSSLQQGVKRSKKSFFLKMGWRPA